MYHMHTYNTYMYILHTYMSVHIYVCVGYICKEL